MFRFDIFFSNEHSDASNNSEDMLEVAGWCDNNRKSVRLIAGGIPFLYPFDSRVFPGQWLNRPIL